MAFPGPDPKFFDDLARVAGGAVNIVSGMQEQIRNDIRARVEEMATRMDLVARDELDMARALIDKQRQRIDTLESRIAALEGKGKPAAAKNKTPAPRKATLKKPATKKAKKKA